MVTALAHRLRNQAAPRVRLAGHFRVRGVQHENTRLLSNKKHYNPYRLR